MYDPLDIHIGRRLKQARIEKGKTVETLAAELGAQVSELEAYELGAARITSGRLIRACDALGVEPTYFFAGFPEK